MYTHEFMINNNFLATSQLPLPPSFMATPGVVPDMSGRNSPIDFFRLFFNDKVMDLIFTETTRYAQQYLEREREYLQQHPQARAHAWEREPLTLKELEVFLAILIAMGICGFPTIRYVYEASKQQ